MQPIIRSVNNYGILLSPLGDEWKEFFAVPQTKAAQILKAASASKNDIVSIYSDNPNKGMRKAFRTRSTTFWGATPQKKAMLHATRNQCNNSFYMERAQDSFATLEGEPDRTKSFGQMQKIYKRKSLVRSANKSFTQGEKDIIAAGTGKNPACFHIGNGHAASKKISFTVIKKLANKHSKGISAANFSFTEKDKNSILNVNIQT